MRWGFFCVAIKKRAALLSCPFFYLVTIQIKKQPPTARCATLKSGCGCVLPLVPRAKSHRPLKWNSFNGACLKICLLNVTIQHRVKHSERVGRIPSTKTTGDGCPESFVKQGVWVTRTWWAEPTLRCEAGMDGKATSHRLPCMMDTSAMGQNQYRLEDRNA